MDTKKQEKYKRIELLIFLTFCLCMGSALAILPWAFHAFEVGISHPEKGPSILLVFALWTAAMLLFLWVWNKLNATKRDMERQMEIEWFHQETAESRELLHKELEEQKSTISATKEEWDALRKERLSKKSQIENEDQSTK